VATEPPMDLISKLIPPYCLVWCSLNKAVSLSVKWRRPRSITDRFQVCHANGCGLRFTSQLCTLRFHNHDCLHISICGTSFFYFFQNLPNFSFRG